MMNQIDIGAEIKQVLQGTIGEEMGEKIDQSIQDEKLTQLNVILGLCNFFMEEINEKATVEIQKGNLVAKSATLKEDSTYTEKDLMTYGARIIYLIRHLLIQDDISFLFGSTTSNGDTNTVLVSQMELMTRLEYVGENKIGIYLSKLESNLNSIQTFSKALEVSKRINLWSKVFGLAKIDDYQEDEVEKLKGKSLNAHQLYQKQKDDKKVHLTYHDANHKKEYYYNVNGNFKYFNFGWLWEWYNSILYGESNELYNKVTNQIENNSIQGVILSIDSIPGTRQGDFVANVGNLHNQQVQTKFNNQKIISYNNIQVIMIQLTQALKEYSSTNDNSQERKNKLMEVLSYHFIPDTVMNVNQFANNIVQNLTNTIPKRI